MKTLVSVLLALNCGCASLDKTMTLGGAVGAVSGLATGYAINFNIKGLALTTATGAALGAVVGYLLHPRQRATSELPDIGKFNKEFPTLSNSKVDSLWIPDQIEDSRFVEGHWIHEIQDPSRWTLKSGEEINDGTTKHNSK